MNIVAMVSLATMASVILYITNIENLIVVNKKIDGNSNSSSQTWYRSTGSTSRLSLWLV